MLLGDAESAGREAVFPWRRHPPVSPFPPGRGSYGRERGLCPLSTISSLSPEEEKRRAAGAAHRG